MQWLKPIEATFTKWNKNYWKKKSKNTWQKWRIWRHKPNSNLAIWVPKPPISNPSHKHLTLPIVTNNSNSSNSHLIFSNSLVCGFNTTPNSHNSCSRKIYTMMTSTSCCTRLSRTGPSPNPNNVCSQVSLTFTSCHWWDRSTSFNKPKTKWSGHQHRKELSKGSRRWWQKKEAPR